MRAFVLVGATATASADFLLDDLPGTSGRLDVLVRAVRAALLVSHGVRRDTNVYLVLLGGPRAPWTVRIRGGDAKFVRPDERSLAVLVRKALARSEQEGLEVASSGFLELARGVAIARGGLEAALADAGAAPLYVLDEGGADVRGAALERDAVFVVGDHLGFDEATRAILAARGARSIGLGPVSVHTEDAVAILQNELDRRGSA